MPPNGRTVSFVAKILLVEDEEINRALVGTILRRSPDPAVRDAELVEAADLAQARERLTADDFAVMLVDLQLPDGSGLELVGEVTRAESHPAIVMLTGDMSAERRAEALAAGCDAFLDKPYTAGALRSLLAEYL
jgi:two-component system, OmpR family, KDP operon response regulator KdpE